MRSVQPPSNPRPTPVLPRPAYLVRLTLDGLDAWTSNPVLHGLGGCLRDSILAACWEGRIILPGWLASRAAPRRRNTPTPDREPTHSPRDCNTVLTSTYRRTEPATVANVVAHTGKEVTP